MNVVAVTEQDEESRLLAAIYAAPADDEPRAAYAAWLTARGAPLAGFITAQLARDPAAAEACLPQAVASVPMPVLGTPPVAAFDRGFLHVCVTRGELALPSAAHDGWRLIAHLRLLEPLATELVEAVGPRLSALRSFETERGEPVEALARSCPHALEVLRIGHVESWFDLSPLLDERTVLELGLAGVFELRRDPGKLHLSPSALPFRHDAPLRDVLRTVVRPRDEISFVFMGDRTPVDAVRDALADIPHGVFTEHELCVV